MALGIRIPVSQHFPEKSLTLTIEPPETIPFRMRNLILGFVTMLLLGATKVDEKEVALGTQSVNFASLTGNTEYTITVQGNAVTGAKAYEASAVASINLTPDGIHIEDITAAGSYAVEGLSVMAVNG